MAHQGSKMAHHVSVRTRYICGREELKLRQSRHRKQLGFCLKGESGDDFRMGKLDRGCTSNVYKQGSPKVEVDNQRIPWLIKEPKWPILHHDGATCARMAQQASSMAQKFIGRSNITILAQKQNAWLSHHKTRTAETSRGG